MGCIVETKYRSDRTGIDPKPIPELVSGFEPPSNFTFNKHEAVILSKMHVSYFLFLSFLLFVVFFFRKLHI